ncbi:hypothetical protein KP001_09205 [Geomonas subterranea]|uniref:Secreted protein n=1 Tax=Geomonas subterranea TaxID=2847989 RepID=A0ABX8LKW8_9BACT|nr:hypothetical protein [Geomonas subterranea]QXE92675.1 hypothetical protein KP001_09205 [Geomonas subterranea]QXM09226.1 hypothetical protein KP002_20070 [Geomonas subterranea]
MKRKIVVGIALVLGTLSVTPLTAFAGSVCGNCADKGVVEQFVQETAPLASEVKAKEIELRYVYSNEGADSNEIYRLEGEIKELKDKINLVAKRLDIPPCNRN